MAAEIRKTVFPVAGLGTRFLPATKAVPKELLPVVDKPLVQYAVEEAAAAGADEFIFVNAPGKDAIAAHFRPDGALEAALEAAGKTAALDAVRAIAPAGARFVFVIQEEPLGLGHAIGCAREAVGDAPFAVILPDDLVMSKTPCLTQMVTAWGETGGNLVAVEDVPRAQVSRYGILDVARDDGRLVAARGIVEKPAPAEAPSTLAVIGRYILDPGIFDCLAGLEIGAGGEIQLTDALSAMIGATPLHGLRFEGRRFDCGDKLGLLEANIAYARARDDLGPHPTARLEG